MFDEYLRGVKDRLLWSWGGAIGRRIAPNAITVGALVAGLAAAAAAWRRAFIVGLLLWMLNRVLDGLDGTVARAANRQTNFGGYLDIVLDFVVYAAIPVALAVADGSRDALLAAVLLLATYYVNAASWLYLAALVERRRPGGSAARATTVAMPPGLIAGFETAIIYAGFFLWPRYLVPAMVGMAVLVAATVLQRLSWARRHVT